KKRFVHHVELQGLQPNTEYVFTIRSQGPTRGGQYFRFRTMPKTLPKHLRFVTGGDMMHDRKRVDAMNKRAAELNPWFALLGGDLAYANGNSNEVGKWDDWLESWMLNCIRRGDGGLIPMVVAIGNHEVAGGTGKVPKDAKYF
ncbi:MAG: purple acid phosphatase family protein, partial [Limisphaerales bacterium]